MSNAKADEDAAMQQYIWVSTNTPGGWESEAEPIPTPTTSSPSHSEPSGSAFPAYADNTFASSSSSSQPHSKPTAQETPTQPRRRRRRTKQCRICLDTANEDDPIDPELGRLMSPCKCKGSARYVHEECLRAWRLHSANSQSFYKCPTCFFEYKFRRLKIAQMIGSVAVQMGLTTLIFWVTVYLLGFVADPIINFYINPWDVVGGGNLTVQGFTLLGPSLQSRRPPAAAAIDEKVGLVEHMVRGLSALGLIGFAKVLFFSHHWIRYIFGGPGVARRNDGRDRIGQLSWIIIAWGVLNFLIFVWGFVQNWSKRVLDKIAIGVADIGSDADDEYEDDGVKEE